MEKTEELIPQEIYATPSAIEATMHETHPAAAKAAKALRSQGVRRIYIIGNGTSLYSSLAAGYTARALAAPGDALVLPWAAGDFRYFPPQLDENDAVVGVSASGEFRDVLAVFESLRGRSLCIGITHVPGSSITRLADHILVSGGGPSRVPVMTKTYGSTLTAAHLLLLEYFGAGEEIFADLSASAGRITAALQAADQQMGAITGQVARMQHAFYFGAGPAYAAALETSLKMKEMALFHAEGSETWEMASGPATRVAADTFCVALSAGQSADADTLAGAQHYHGWGAPVLEVGPTATAGGWHFPVEAPRFPPFATLSLVPPLALLAYRTARLRGHTPDRPAWRERYYAQGMTHILGDPQE